MREYQTTILVNKKVVSVTKHQWPYFARDLAHTAFDAAFWGRTPSGDMNLMAEGEVISIPFNCEVLTKCLMNHRAPRRAPEVIAAEKATLAVKARARAVQRQKEKERSDRWCLAQQKRISNQISHAFLTNKAGSEPAAKYITCHCSNPAVFLYLNQPIAPGAAILDEKTIIMAVCAEHDSHYVRQQYSAIVIPCSRLEFFYDGVRQVALKEVKS